MRGDTCPALRDNRFCTWIILLLLVTNLLTLTHMVLQAQFRHAVADLHDWQNISLDTINERLDFLKARILNLERELREDELNRDNARNRTDTGPAADAR